MSTKHVMFPSGGGTSASALQFDFFSRVNEGVGNYSMNVVIPRLIVAFPSGMSDAVRLDVITDIVATHMMNSGLADFWSPETGAVQQEALKALESFRPRTWGGANTVHALFIDGQFGRLSVGT